MKNEVKARGIGSYIPPAVKENMHTKREAYQSFKIKNTLKKA
jgi:hypothetical protein